MSGRLNLRRQSHKDYKRKNYNNNMFNITEEPQDNRIILLQFNSDNVGITEDKFDAADADYIFLTKTLARKEGLNKQNDSTLGANMNDVTKLAKYLLLTEHIGWRKGLKLFREKGDEAVEKGL